MNADREAVIDLATNFIDKIRALTDDPHEMAPLLTALSVMCGEVLVQASHIEGISCEALRDRMVETMDMSIERGKQLYEN